VLITLFTDASFSNRYKRGTWAAWFKVDGKTSRFSGTIVAELQQSGDAELAALANGLFAITRTLGPTTGDKIIAQTDSVEAITAVRMLTHSRPYAKDVVTYIDKLRNIHGFTLELRHVKGHKGAQTPRHAVNTWCDGECRRLMGLLIAERQQPKPPGDPICACSSTLL